MEKMQTACEPYNWPQGQENATPEGKFSRVLETMAETFRRKNHDYGDSYAKSVRELGIIGGVAPIFNKCNRLVQLAKGDPALVRDEALEDTLLDLASYCVMLKIALDNGRNESK